MPKFCSHKLVATEFLLLAMSVGPCINVATAQSNADKAKTCNDLADKKGLQGDDRKTFLQDCVNKTTNAKPPSEMSQKEKVDACKNLADKKNLTGQDRKSFLKDCMNKANPK